jgi:ribonucleotide reductase beta subunit family protein with ferritin-like domain
MIKKLFQEAGIPLGGWQLVSVLPGPFSNKSKEAALQKDIKENYDSYFQKAVKGRMWFADRLKERDEMPAYGHLISAETKEVLLGFLGVESFVNDYVFCGMNGAGDDLSVSSLYMQWGFEERRHGETFRHILIDSGLYTSEFVDDYLDKCAEYRWTFLNQTGFEEAPLIASAYATFQERQTRWNYTKIRMRVWEEYGSPTDSRGRNIFPAAAGAIRYPEVDEGAHEANFSNVVRIYMKYFPDATIDALDKVSNKYRMPKVQLPNAEEFMRCVIAAGMGDSRYVISEIMNPTLARMGLLDRHSLRTAVKNFRALGPGSVVHIQGVPVQEQDLENPGNVFTMLPTGEFVSDNPE